MYIFLNIKNNNYYNFFKDLKLLIHFYPLKDGVQLLSENTDSCRQLRLLAYITAFILNPFFYMLPQLTYSEQRWD